MNVAVCDDDAGTRRQMQGYLEQYEKEQGTELALYFYDSGEAFLEAYPMKIDILFLDIRMYQVSGMDIARHIRDMDEELCIIFISNMTQYALEGYRVHAFDFIVKPFDYPFFKKVFSLACRRIDRRKNETIHVKNDSGLFSLQVSRIIYAETLDHKLLLHTDQKAVVCYISMGQLEKKLAESNFFRCHQSFLINLAWMEELGKDSVRMRGGDVVPVSRHRRRELVQAMTKYAGEVL